MRSAYSYTGQFHHHKQAHQLLVSERGKGHRVEVNIVHCLRRLSTSLSYLQRFVLLLPLLLFFFFLWDRSELEC